MSKYHKGDKFIVEIKEVINSDNVTLYRSDFKTLTFDDYELDKLQKCETELSWDECYNRGLEDGRNEVWELVQRLYNISLNEIKHIFGANDFNWDEREIIEVIVKQNTPQEALAKLEVYEKEQAEIKVGDVVMPEKGVEFIVTYISSDSHLFGITKSGDTYTALPMKYCKKTGKHIDVQSVLSQIAE